MTQEMICSAKGCRTQAEHALLWRNPRIHADARRKVWLACEAHREHLAGFLRARSFLLDVIGTEDLDESHG